MKQIVLLLLISTAISSCITYYPHSNISVNSSRVPTPLYKGKDTSAIVGSIGFCGNMFQSTNEIESPRSIAPKQLQLMHSVYGQLGWVKVWDAFHAGFAGFGYGGYFKETLGNRTLFNANYGGGGLKLFAGADLNLPRFRWQVIDFQTSLGYDFGDYRNFRQQLISLREVNTRVVPGHVLSQNFQFGTGMLFRTHKKFRFGVEWNLCFDGYWQEGYNQFMFSSHGALLLQYQRMHLSYGFQVFPEQFNIPLMIHVGVSRFF